MKIKLTKYNNKFNFLKLLDIFATRTFIDGQIWKSVKLYLLTFD